ncbi:SIR2 family protein [Longispora albida]|uniref:SIR2 family protein n=1 Tax=Longispora albida TaxID=203523 RepID=UPI0012F73675|nr:SIR2 family protein [Longispora albida]
MHLCVDTQRPPRGGFEELLGPLDRLVDTLVELMAIEGIFRQRKRKPFRLTSSRIATLYRHGAGIVLEEVAEASIIRKSSPEWLRYRAFIDWMENVRDSRRLNCFTLNYDALLDGAFLERDSDMADEAAPFKPTILTDRRHGSIPVFKLRDPDRFSAVPPKTKVLLNHLHGSVQWVEHAGEIYKAGNLQELRSARVFQYDPNGDAFYNPAVVLTDRKSQIVRRQPFESAYRNFSASLERAEGIVIAGYGLGDVPVNVTIRKALTAKVLKDEKFKIVAICPEGKQAFLDAIAPQGEADTLRGYLDDPQTFYLTDQSLPGAIQTDPLASWNW